MTIVLLVVAACGDSEDWTTTSISRVSGMTSSRTLSVTVEHSRCGDGGVRVRLSEAEAQVELIPEQDRSGDCEDIGLSTDMEVDLADELAGRRIVVVQARPDASPECIIDGASSERCESASSSRSS